MANLTRFGYEDVNQDDELRRKVIHVSDLGTLTAATNQAAAVVSGLPDSGGTIEGTRITVVTAPTGATGIFDVHLNGTTIYTTQGNRPTIAISAKVSTEAAAPSNAADPVVPWKVYNGDLLTVDCDQIGSSAAGAVAGIAITIKVDKPLDDD
jgi:hypothetical protein|tara:strand:+ start:1073 stop:1528 length:456 start_codon:yes stop_codon:yes gene_type:complete